MLKFNLDPSDIGLLFRADDSQKNHDYSPNWDYEVDESPNPVLAALVKEAAESLFKRTRIPFEVWAVKLHDDTVAKYIYGTSSYPVVIIDLEAHIGYEWQLEKTLRHELKHAEQEQEGREFDEEEAEMD